MTGVSTDDGTVTIPAETRSDDTPERSYRPQEHLIPLDRGRGGRGLYMMTEDRVLWFRHDFPQGQITQELVKLDLERGYALFKTVVATGDGGIGEGYGSETMVDFADFLEKAATKSLGRALGSLGYGTKGALAEGEAADAPADLPHLGSRGGNAANVPSPYGRNDGGPRQPQPDGRARAQPNSIVLPNTADATLATERQIKFIHVLARESGLDEQELAAWSQELYGKEVDKLGRRDAGNLIEALQRRRNEVS